ncbi:MAG: YtxH domain-containing protein [Ferruginibacter sp.]
MNSGKLLSGILIGAAAGAVLGVLFAPEKGTETRGKISKKGADLKNTVKDKINDLVDGISSHYEGMKSDAEDAYQEGKEKFGKAKSEAKNSFS